MSKILKNLFIGFISFSLISSIIVLAILWNFSNNIPDYKFLKNYKPPVSSKVYSGNGDLVADFSREKRIFVPYETIPRNVINAFLSAEDKNFFSHPGVDAKGILRAIVNNIKNVYEYYKSIDKEEEIKVHMMMLPGEFEKAEEIIKYLRALKIEVIARRIRPQSNIDGDLVKPWESGMTATGLWEGDYYSPTEIKWLEAGA